MSGVVGHVMEILDVRQRRRLVALIAMSAVGSLADSLGVMLMFVLVKLVSDPGAVGELQWLAWLYEKSGAGGPGPFVGLVAIAVFVLFVLKNAYTAALYYLQCEFCHRGAAEFSTRLYRGYVHAPYATHLRRHSAELVRNVRELGNHVYKETLMALLAISVEVMVLAGITLVLFTLQPLATALAGAMLAAVFVAQERVLGRMSGLLGQRYLEVAAALQKAIQEGLRGLKETKILGHEAHAVGSFAVLQERFSRIVGRQVFLSQVHRQTNEAMVVVGVTVVVTLTLAREDDIAALLAPLALFAAAAFRMVPAVNRIMYNVNVLRHYSASVRVALDEIRAFGAPNRAEGGEDGHARRLPFREEIRLAGVSYRYASGEGMAVRNVSASVRRGTCVGVVGESGAGKSTLADLLLGLLEPTGGQVLVDGIDVAGDRRAWQRNLGYVPPHVHIADESLRRNVALGVMDSEVDDERVHEALRLARLDEFVATLPRGIATPLGEQGARLSDGQRQRVGIARALYHDPAVVVLDEATAALDVSTEHEVTRAIRDLKGHTTLVVIAHRLSTVKECDQLLLMKDAELVDVGTFRELVERNPEFARAVDLADVSAATARQP